MKEALEALGVDIKLLIVQITGFLILFFILKKYLFGRIMGFMQEREEKIRKTFEDQDRQNRELRDLRQTYEERLAKVEEEASRRLQSAVKEAQVLSDDIIKRTHAEAERIKEKAAQDIEQEKKKALSEVRAEVVDLSILACQKILKKSIDRTTAKELVDEFLKDLETYKG